MDTYTLFIIRGIEKSLRVAAEALANSNPVVAEEALIIARADLVSLREFLDAALDTSAP